MKKTWRKSEIKQSLGINIEDLLRQKYVIENKNTVEIAKLLGVTDGTVGDWLRYYKIPVRSISEVMLRGKQKPSEEQLRKWYEIERRSSVEIAEIIGVDRTYICNLLHDYKIPVRTVSEAMLNGKNKPSEQQLRQWYDTEKKTAYEIAELVGVSNTSILRWLRNYKIPIRSLSEIQLGANKKLREEQLRQSYEIEGKNTPEIAESIGVAASTVSKWLRDYKIPIRSISEVKLYGKKKPSEKQLNQWYGIERINTVEIGKMVGVRAGTVSHWLNEYKIPIRNSAESKFGPSKNPGKEQLREWYEVENKSTEDIAKIIRVGSVSILRWLHEYKIPIRNQDNTRQLKKEALEKVIERYAA
jgi:transposase